MTRLGFVAAALVAFFALVGQALAQTNVQLPSGEQCFSALAPTSGGTGGTGTGYIGFLGTITGGTGGTAGTYSAALTGGSGSGATANFTVSGGAVTAVAVYNPGVGYVAGDTLSATPSTIGGVTGFSVPVSSVSINQAVAGGSVGYYIPSTLTTKTTWKDAGGVTPNTNPITLDANGCAIVYGSGTYRQILKDSLGNIVWDQLTTSPQYGVPVLWYASNAYGNNGTTVYNAVHAAGGGTILVPGGAVDPYSTMPSSWTDAALFYLGPSQSMISAPAITKLLFRDQHPSPHTSSIFATTGIEALIPVGSGQNGPTAADAGLWINAVKTNWNLASGPGFGEVDGLDIFVRNGGPTPSGGNQADACGACIGVANAGLTGYTAGTEAVTTNYSQGASPTALAQVAASTAVVDTHTGSTVVYGVTAVDFVGTGTAAYLATTSGGTWTCAFRTTLTNNLCNIDANSNVAAFNNLAVGSVNLNSAANSLVSCTGLGSGATCTLATGSSNLAGKINLNTGTGPSSTGNVSMNFSGGLGSHNSQCVFALENGTGSWGSSSAIQGAGTASTYGFTWTNSVAGSAASNLTGSVTYVVGYMCIGF